MLKIITKFFMVATNDGNIITIVNRWYYALDHCNREQFISRVQNSPSLHYLQEYFAESNLPVRITDRILSYDLGSLFGIIYNHGSETNNKHMITGSKNFKWMSNWIASTSNPIKKSFESRQDYRFAQES